MKRLMLLVVTLALLAVPASAQFVGRTLTVTQLPLCQNPAQFAVVTDATNATTLGAGGGSATVWVTCASGSWAVAEVAAVADLSGYVQDSEAAQVSIEASGAGNDVTLLAADDIILTPTDALTVAPGGNATITTTAGNVTLTAGGTTQDASIISTDDIFLTPDDALTAVAGGATTITSTTGTVAIQASAGAVTVTAVGATNDVSLVAADDVILTPTDDLTVNPTGLVNIIPGESFAVTTTAGAVTLTAGGTTEDISLISVDQVIIDGAGGSDEVVIDDDTVTIHAEALLRLTPSSAPPVACAAGTEGGLYFDSDTHLLCACNASAWVQVADGSTGCS